MFRRKQPGEVFPGAKGFVLLVALEDMGYRKGKVSKCRYSFGQGVERYVDRRDLPDLPKEAFQKLDNADHSTAHQEQG